VDRFCDFLSYQPANQAAGHCPRDGADWSGRRTHQGHSSCRARKRSDTAADNGSGGATSYRGSNACADWMSSRRARDGIGILPRHVFRVLVELHDLCLLI
jgi:hypothetical protein